MESIKKILLVGGTHGNELTGVYLHQKWSANMALLRRLAPSAELELLLANPLAVAMCRRYVTYDLNRCFAQETLDLQESPAMYQEIQRAHELNSLYGPKGENAFLDLIIDIHNTRPAWDSP